ncbi:ASCH domain-containing protein [Aminobacter sp. MET-1]|uniref:ASCH domain-containing protein n=1 Tax=Aminobacter sp. MET-1 TaxID=2951085 RepID=UPI002269AB53|nr:ASCH domain-containing protein [Aminobacter sp. MET-1]MCX8571861.1 ASCH domain-containing protein [Aminobacter sp. MET-1]
MLLKQAILEGIKRGDITLAFRRWQRPTVKAGTGLRTAIGVIRIGVVEVADEGTLTEADAHAAGYDSLGALTADLREGSGRTLYRITFEGIEADNRPALREAADLSDADWHALAARFAKWDSTAPGYFPSILRLIGQNPEVAAATLADRLGVEKPKFKQDVRKLKELGLTESLDIGYRLSRRGSAALEKLREHRL